MNDLLPFNANAHERALSLATARVGSVSIDPIRDQWNPWACPLETLPWLAWALAVTPWNPQWTEGQKRSAIAVSLSIHRQRGTIGAVKQALAALGYVAVVRENSSGAYVFDVDLSVADPTIYHPTIFADATEIILRAKNVRSKLGQLSLATSAQARALVGAATVYGLEVSVFPNGYGS